MAAVLTLLQIGTAGLDRSKAREHLAVTDAWVMRAVRSFQGKIETSPGRTAYMPDILSGIPTDIFAWRTDGDSPRLNVGTTTKLYRLPTSGSESLVDITRLAGAYTGGADNYWHLISYANTMLGTNGVDVIQQWDGTSANAVNLSGSPPVATTMAPFLTYVVVGNISGSPRLIQWSDSGSATTWTGGDASSLTLYQGPGPVYRLLPLGDVLVAYRSNSIHILFFVGQPFIFGQRQVVTTVGLIAPRAVVDLGGRHLYWGTDNVYLFDGVNNIPVGDKVIAAMQASYLPDNQSRIMALADLRDREVYFCYPSSASPDGTCDMAWVYNYGTGAWREEPFSLSTVTAVGRFQRRQGVAWSDIVGIWTSQTDPWQAQTLAARLPIALAATGGGTVMVMDRAVVDDLGTARERLMETGIIEPGRVAFQRPGHRCTLEEVDIEFEHIGTLTIELWVATLNMLAGDTVLTWTKYSLTTNATTFKKTIPTRLTAQYFLFRLRTEGVGQAFRVSGLSANFTLRGDR